MLVLGVLLVQQVEILLDERTLAFIRETRLRPAFLKFSGRPVLLVDDAPLLLPRQARGQLIRELPDRVLHRRQRATGVRDRRGGLPLTARAAAVINVI